MYHTNKLWCSKDVFKLNIFSNLVGQAKIYEFDSGQRCVLIQKHDVFRLQTGK